MSFFKRIFAKTKFNIDYLSVVLIILFSVFEILENQPEQIIKYRKIETDSSNKTNYTGDSLLNIFGDIVFNIAGIYLGYAINSCISIITILVILFLIITKTVGFNYWTDFFKFTFIGLIDFIKF